MQAAMETTFWKLETDNGTMMISFNETLRHENKDEFIEFIDKCQEYIDKKAWLTKIPKSEIVKLFGLGVILPSVDVWSDVYLAVKLYSAGHEGYLEI